MDINVKEQSNEIDKKIIGVQVPYQIYEQLKDLAMNRFISISDLIRSYIFKCIQDDINKK